jgi:hypothetical protein
MQRSVRHQDVDMRAYFAALAIAHRPSSPSHLILPEPACVLARPFSAVLAGILAVAPLLSVPARIVLQCLYRRQQTFLGHAGKIRLGTCVSWSCCALLYPPRSIHASPTQTKPIVPTRRQPPSDTLFPSLFRHPNSPSFPLPISLFSPRTRCFPPRRPAATRVLTAVSQWYRTLDLAGLRSVESVKV